MAAGLPGSMADINRMCGQGVLDVANSLSRCLAIGVMLNDAQRYGGQAGLVANLGFATADATLLLNAYTDMASLSAVAHGQQAQPGASDFFWNAKLLMGAMPM
jgi:hypothetical protein